jgi:hypothetical protein
LSFQSTLRYIVCVSICLNHQSIHPSSHSRYIWMLQFKFLPLSSIPYASTTPFLPFPSLLIYAAQQYNDGDDVKPFDNVGYHHSFHFIVHFCVCLKIEMLRFVSSFFSQVLPCLSSHDVVGADCPNVAAARVLWWSNH